MRNLILIVFCCLLVAATAGSQPNMEDFDEIGYIQPDGYRIFFDFATYWEFGGPLNDPALSFWQSQPMVEAWLVLVEPTAAAIGGYRLGMRTEGSHVMMVTDILGNPISIQIVDDVVYAMFDPPLPAAGEPVLLVRWQFLNVTFEPVLIFLWPALEDDVPTYFDGDQAVIAANTYNGAYHDYEAAVAILNGPVTSNEKTAWSDIKTLFR